MSQDASLEKGYLEILDALVLGNRRTHDQWLAWFSETDGNKSFEKRIAQVFQERGHVPTPTQFNRAKAELTSNDESEEEPQEVATKSPRGTKREDS